MDLDRVIDFVGDTLVDMDELDEWECAIRILTAAQKSGLSEDEIVARLHPIPDAPAKRCELCTHWEYNKSVSDESCLVLGYCETSAIMTQQDYGCTLWKQKGARAWPRCSARVSLRGTSASDGTFNPASRSRRQNNPKKDHQKNSSK